jgi:hypothetical protein
MACTASANALAAIEGGDSLGLGFRTGDPAPCQFC